VDDEVAVRRELEQAFVPSMQTTPPIKIVFELREDGKKHAVRHPLLGEMQTAARDDDLPDGWDERDCRGYR
jgi:hypothetical protein